MDDNQKSNSSDTVGPYQDCGFLHGPQRAGGQKRERERERRG